MYFLSVLLASYVAFAFASERLNPFIRPRSKLKRRQWRQGITHAVGVFVAGVVIRLVEMNFDLTTFEQIAIFVAVMVAVLVIRWLYARQRRKSRRSDL